VILGLPVGEIETPVPEPEAKMTVVVFIRLKRKIIFQIHEELEEGFDNCLKEYKIHTQSGQ
jgi:hypothetical protein